MLVSHFLFLLAGWLCLVLTPVSMAVTLTLASNLAAVTGPKLRGWFKGDEDRNSNSPAESESQVDRDKTTNTRVEVSTHLQQFIIARLGLQLTAVLNSLLEFGALCNSHCCDFLSFLRV